MPPIGLGRPAVKPTTNIASLCFGSGSRYSRSSVAVSLAGTAGIGLALWAGYRIYEGKPIIPLAWQATKSPTTSSTNAAERVSNHAVKTDRPVTTAKPVTVDIQPHFHQVPTQQEVADPAVACIESPIKATPIRATPLPRESSNSEVAIMEDTVPNISVSEGHVLEDIVSKNIAPEDVVTEDIVPEDVVTEDIVPEDVVPKNVVPEDIVPENVIPVIPDVVPKDVAPEDVIPKDIVPEDVVPEDVASSPNSSLVQSRTVSPVASTRASTDGGLSDLAKEGCNPKNTHVALPRQKICIPPRLAKYFEGYSEEENVHRGVEGQFVSVQRLASKITPHIGTTKHPSETESTKAMEKAQSLVDSSPGPASQTSLVQNEGNANLPPHLRAALNYVPAVMPQGSNEPRKAQKKTWKQKISESFDAEGNSIGVTVEMIETTRAEYEKAVADPFEPNNTKTSSTLPKNGKKQPDPQPELNNSKVRTTTQSSGKASTAEPAKRAGKESPQLYVPPQARQLGHAGVAPVLTAKPTSSTQPTAKPVPTAKHPSYAPPPHLTHPQPAKPTGARSTTNNQPSTSRRARKRRARKPQKLGKIGKDWINDVQESDAKLKGKLGGAPVDAADDKKP